VASGAAVQVDAALLAFVPAAVDGVPLTFDPGTSATIAADPSVAPDAASLAVALAIVPGASAADDLAVVSVVRLRDPAKDETWFRDWRDTYDQAACSPAGGLVGNAEAEIGGGTVYIGSCAGGVRTYHTRLAAAGIDYVQPSAVKNGITAQWEICRRAEQSGVTCVPHSPYFGPGYLATLHILAAKQKEVALERFFCDLGHMPYGASVPVENGWVQIPDVPGLGPDPDEELMRFRV